MPRSKYLPVRPAATKSGATAAQLRVALECIMRDVTSGKLSGRNPWSLDSVKAASETLTGLDWAALSSSQIPE